MMTENEVIALLQRYEDQECTPQEAAFLDNWYLHQMKKNTDLPLSDTFLIDKAASLQLILAEMSARNRTTVLKRSIFLYKKYHTIANIAVLILCLSISFLVYKYMGMDRRQIESGQRTAMLTLPGGKRIALATMKNGIISRSGNMEVRKKNDMITFHRTGTVKAGEAAGNFEIETPNGLQYTVLLPDRSKIWLNAATKMTLPVDYNIALRKIQLNGEGYFEVAANQGHPFQIKTKRQIVEVLGTKFNISSYSDERNTKTTLIEGSLKVTPLPQEISKEQVINAKVIAPNEESILSTERLTVRQVNAPDATTWKDGYFTFSDEPLEGVMADLARWYDLTIVYTDPTLRAEKITGALNKRKSIAELVKTLEEMGTVIADQDQSGKKRNAIHFTLRGRLLEVYR